MRRIIIAVLLGLLLSGGALAEEYPQPYRGEIIGTWGFCGGAEELGDGFRLNPDGTGVYLEIVDYGQVPPQYRETDSTFTWRAEYAADKTYLHETYAGGRTVTHEVETWGGSRIHIPNDVSGGFYYPVLNDATAAYLAEKPEHSAFDGVIADYLDGSITGKIAATGLQVGEIFLQQEGGAWRIVFGVYDREKKLDYRFILDEDYVTVLADEAGWLWGDYDLGQPWFAPDTTQRYYDMLPGILQSYLTWEYNPQPTPTPEPPALPELTAQLGAFPKNRTYPVYEALIGGDDEPNRRAGNGKAKVSTNGDIWVYATWRGHLLIEYEIGGGRNRIGWIDASDLPSYTLDGVPELPNSRDTEENVYGAVTGADFLTSDPLQSGISLPGRFHPGFSVHVLASLEDWYLVEGFAAGELRMGFLRQDKVDLDNGYAANPEWEIGRCTRYTEEDVQAAFDALARHIYHSWPGTGLISIRYDEDDADYVDPNPWWTDDTGTMEGILLLTDLSSMELYHLEIAGAFAQDYIFILHREPGGPWQVVNWGYT